MLILTITIIANFVVFFKKSIEAILQLVIPLGVVSILIDYDIIDNYLLIFYENYNMKEVAIAVSIAKVQTIKTFYVLYLNYCHFFDFQYYNS